MFTALGTEVDGEIGVAATSLAKRVELAFLAASRFRLPEAFCGGV